MNSQILEVAKREIVTRGRTKAFRVITALIVAAVIAGPIIAAVWPEGDDSLREVTVGLTDDAPDGIGELISAVAEGRLDVTTVSVGDADIDSKLSDGDVDVVVESGPTLAWNEAADGETDALLRAALQQVQVAERADDAAIDPEVLGSLFRGVEVEERFVDENDTTDAVRDGVSFVGLFLAFLIPQVFGQLTMMSVVEEKSTGVIEVLLSHIRPRTLLGGKVLGLSVLAIAQIVLLAGGLALSLFLVNAFDVPSSVWQFVPVLLVGVIGGLLVYTTLFALVGSLISRQEDASQVMLPIFIPIMAGYIVGQQAIFSGGEGLVARILTIFPLTSPMLLPVRVAQGTIAPWEVVLAIALLLLSVVVLLRLAGRVYEFALLRRGARIGWGETFRRLRGLEPA